MIGSRHRCRVDRRAVVQVDSGRSLGFVVPIPARRVTYKDHNTNVQACKNHNKIIYRKIDKVGDIRKVKKR